MAARNDHFWCDIQFEVGLLPIDDASKADLSMGGCLDDNVEKRSCCKTVLIGPLLDGYIGQLAMQFNHKISRGKNTGLQESTNIFFPYHIFIQFAKLVKGYGGDFIPRRDKKGEIKDLLITINSQETTKMVWHPRRLNGCNFLSKRKFIKVPAENGKQTLRYDGYTCGY